MDHLIWICAKGFCQFKKKPKMREKLGVDGHLLPSPQSIFYFVLETCLTKKNTVKKHKKHLPPKKKSELGLEPPTHPLPSFSRIF